VVDLPDLYFQMELVCIPAGPFIMGSDQWDDERPVHELTLPEYFIGKYPVTNQQYGIFAGATQRKFEVPKDKEQHPVVDVNWKDALAFCQWLSTVSQHQIVLPSEAEWEKAARGAESGPLRGHGRNYPWGNAQPDNRLCNFNNPLRGTTPVGMHSPQGDSPYGCADLSGNVWEWTRSQMRDYPYHFDDGRETLDDNHVRVVRGGSWNASSATHTVRAAYRNWENDTVHYDVLGFRVGCLSPTLGSL